MPNLKSTDLPTKSALVSTDGLLIADSQATTGAVSTKTISVANADVRWTPGTTFTAHQSAAGNGAHIPSGGITSSEIANGAVTLAKIANIATGTLIGRSSAGTGVAETILISTFATASQGGKADTALQPGTAIANISGLQTAIDGKQGLSARLTAIASQANPVTAKLTQLNTDGSISFVDPPSGGGGGLVAANNLSDLTNATTARTNLGLGTAATATASSFATSEQGTLAGTALQPGTAIANIDGLQANLTALALTNTVAQGVLRVDFAYTDTFPKTIKTAINGESVYKIRVVTTESFNGTSANLSIGDSGSSQRFVSTSQSAAILATPGSIEVSGYYTYVTGLPIVINFTPGTATTGKGYVLLESSNAVPASTGGTGGSGITAATFSNANYTITAANYIAQIGTLTAIRTITLPSASTVSAGNSIRIIDQSRTASYANYIAIAPAGSDTIDGLSTSGFNLDIPSQEVTLTSDGTSGWSISRVYPVHQVAQGTEYNKNIWTYGVEGFGVVSTSPAGTILAPGLALSQSGGTAAPDSTLSTGGIPRLRTGTGSVATDYGQIRILGATPISRTNGTINFEAIVNIAKLPTITTDEFNYLCGLASNATAADPSDGAYFAISLTDGGINWYCVTSNANTRTRTNSTVAVVLNTVIKLAIQFTSTNARFYINDVLVATNTTNLSSNGFGAMAGHWKTVGTTLSTQAYFYKVRMNQILLARRSA